MNRRAFMKLVADLLVALPVARVLPIVPVAKPLNGSQLWTEIQATIPRLGPEYLADENYMVAHTAFMGIYGRAPTQAEWEQRWYTGRLKLLQKGIV
jgi:hypothetical protein